MITFLQFSVQWFYRKLYAWQLTFNMLYLYSICTRCKKEESLKNSLMYSNLKSIKSFLMPSISFIMFLNVVLFSKIRGILLLYYGYLVISPFFTCYFWFDFIDCYLNFRATFDGKDCPSNGRTIYELGKNNFEVWNPRNIFSFAG